MVVFENVTKDYPGGVNALHDVSFRVFSGEFISLVGSSGAGKSTLLKLIYAEEIPTAGTIYFKGRPIKDINRKHLPFFRRNIGTIFQDYKLLPQKTAFENIAYALEVDGRSAKEIREEVGELLEIVGLGGKGEKFPRELSGGEQQRVAIARALIHHPQIICADEPTGNLDPVSTKEITDLLLEINSYGTTVIVATHKKEVVDQLGKRVISLIDGRLRHDEAKGKYNIKL
ncbi:MAG: cell division ATP-binding protein FtsE [Candidatus Moraniibacteriota bacterium]|nr:MAG: cell division ATP-binding protein FtsE [Candidatus Moranbacteria bacterium]